VSHRSVAMFSVIYEKRPKKELNSDCVLGEVKS